MKKPQTIPQSVRNEQAADRYRFAREYALAHDVQIKHLRHKVFTPDAEHTNQFGGMTVAFRKEGNFLQVATAVCSDKDNYNAKLGTSLAVERLGNNHFILVPLLGDPVEQVEYMFAGLYEEYIDDGYDEQGFIDDEFAGLSHALEGLQHECAGACPIHGEGLGFDGEIAPGVFFIVRGIPEDDIGVPEGVDLAEILGLHGVPADELGGGSIARPQHEAGDEIPPVLADLLANLLAQRLGGAQRF